MSNKILDQIIEYYEAVYENQDFQKLFDEGFESVIIIQVKMNHLEDVKSVLKFLNH